MPRSRSVSLLAAALAVSSLAACGSTVATGAGSALGEVAPDGLSLQVPASGPVAGASGSVDPLTGVVAGSGSQASTPMGDSVSGPGQDAVSGGAAAGSGAPTTSLGGGTAPVGPAGAPATGPRETAELPVGFLLTLTSNAESAGISFGNTLRERDVDTALVEAINAEGGLAGRKLRAVFGETDTGSANWEQDFAEACATFTQDDRVEAVLGYAFTYFASFEGCLADKAVPHLSTAFNIPDTEELGKYPSWLALSTPTIERRSLAKIDGALATGVLRRGSKVGVLSDACPGTQRSYDATVAPAFRAAGVEVVENISLQCVNSSAEAGSAVNGLSNAIVRFRADGADSVFFHAVSEGPALLLFSIAAESQGYRPRYVVSSLAQLPIVSPQMPAEQVKNVSGFGWFPIQDVAVRDYGPANKSQARCLSLLKSRNVVPAAAADYFYAYSACEPLFLYEAALQRTSGSSAAGAVVSAAEASAPAFLSTTNLDGLSALKAGVHDGPAKAKPLVFTSQCTCFRYEGGTRPIPSR